MSEDNINNVVKTLKHNKDKILNSLDKESIDVYIFLNEEFKKGNILENHVFKFVFKSFYGLDNAGLTDKQKYRFFELLNEKEDNLEYILSELYDIENKKKEHSIQYSFATKLLHTLDNTQPIFDKFIKESLKLVDVSGKDKLEKINSCSQNYQKLKENIYKLLQMEEILEIIASFRKKFNVKENQICDVKALDFILWTNGRLE